jgi:alkylation response protein AidB-like acyl-CoA dehydrogenase
MANFLDDNTDLQFYLGPGVDWDTLAWVTELGYRHPEGFRDAEQAKTFYREVASAVGTFAAEEVAPWAAEIDRQGVRFQNGEASFPPRLAAIFAKMAELDLFGLTLPRELGGTNAPLLLYFVNGELLARADVSVMAHHGFHGGIAMAMLVLSLLEGSTEIDPSTGQVTRTRWPREIADIASGRAWGSMDITEPDAGSDMAALRTVGTKDADGRWRVKGQKIFITSGHGKYHFVVARTGNGEGAVLGENDGLKGLSMFLVRAYEDLPDGGRKRLASLDRIEDKLGHHGSATAALTFDDTPAELVGKPGDGFKLMLELMNHARLGVGFEAIGLCESALRMARGYAAERWSMGKTIDRHEMIADYFEQMEIDIVGLRALAMHAAFHEEVGHKLELFGAALPPRPPAHNNGNGHRNGHNHHTSGAGDTGRQHRAEARRALPLLKYLAAEKAVEMARLCLQIHGGNGYMREYGAEKLLRDALVLPIYEGTSQIQALMATKDMLGAIIKQPQAFLKRLAHARWQSMTARDPRERRVAQLSYLAMAAQQHVVRHLLSAKLKSVRGKPITTWREEILGRWNPREDFSYALLHAERLTRLSADVEISRILFGQSRRHPERGALVDRYLARAEPRVRYLYDEIKHTGGQMLGRLLPTGAAEGARG